MHNSFLLSTFFFFFFFSFPQMLPNASGVEAARGEWERGRPRGVGRDSLAAS